MSHIQPPSPRSSRPQRVRSGVPIQSGPPAKKLKSAEYRVTNLKNRSTSRRSAAKLRLAASDVSSLSAADRQTLLSGYQTLAGSLATRLEQRPLSDAYLTHKNRVSLAEIVAANIQLLTQAKPDQPADSAAVPPLNLSDIKLSATDMDTARTSRPSRVAPLACPPSSVRDISPEDAVSVPSSVESSSDSDSDFDSELPVLDQETPEAREARLQQIQTDLEESREAHEAIVKHVDASGEAVEIQTTRTVSDTVEPNPHVCLTQHQITIAESRVVYPGPDTDYGVGTYYPEYLQSHSPEDQAKMLADREQSIAIARQRYEAHQANIQHLRSLRPADLQEAAQGAVLAATRLLRASEAAAAKKHTRASEAAAAKKHTRASEAPSFPTDQPLKIASIQLQGSPKNTYKVGIKGAFATHYFYVTHADGDLSTWSS